MSPLHDDPKTAAILGRKTAPRRDTPHYRRADTGPSTLPASLQAGRQQYLEAHGRLPS